jgi:hypothetical protein
LRHLLAAFLQGLERTLLGVPRIAALAQRIAAYELRDENLPRGAIVPYEKLPEDKRRDVRALTRRIIQALVMLGHVEA